MTCFFIEATRLIGKFSAISKHLSGPICNMMTSSNGNIFRVTGHLCREFNGPGEFPTQRPVTRSFDVFFNLRLNKRWSKKSWGWWFETHYDVIVMNHSGHTFEESKPIVSKMRSEARVASLIDTLRHVLYELLWPRKSLNMSKISKEWIHCLWVQGSNFDSRFNDENRKKVSQLLHALDIMFKICNI